MVGPASRSGQIQGKSPVLVMRRPSGAAVTQRRGSGGPLHGSVQTAVPRHQGLVDRRGLRTQPSQDMRGQGGEGWEQRGTGWQKEKGLAGRATERAAGQIPVDCS